MQAATGSPGFRTDGDGRGAGYHVAMTTGAAIFPFMHNKTTARRFEITLGRPTAYAKYQLAGDMIVIEHIEVPEALEGRGLAGGIVGVALDCVRMQNLKVLPICPFAKRFIGRHREYQDLLAL